MTKEPTYKSEADVKKEVKRLLTEHKWMYWMPPGSAFGQSTVDFHALKDGAFMAIETKFGANTATALQLKHLRAVRDNGGTALVVSDDRMDSFAELLNDMAKSPEWHTPIPPTALTKEIDA